MPPSQADIKTILTGALLALFLAALEQTIVATALPTIAADLGGFDLISWVVTAYLLSSVCATPIFGKLSDVYGRRPVLATSLLVFLAGSVLCALAPTMLTLILARGLQGIGGGGLITLAQTVIGDVVPPRERGRYAAFFSGVWAVAGLLGPSVGGVLAEHVGWEWIFWLNVPLAMLALAICDRALRRLPSNRRRAHIDYAAILLLSAGTVALLLLLSLAGKDFPWLSPASLGLALAATGFAVLFAIKQRFSAEPILPPRFVTHPVIGPVLSSLFLVFGSYLAVAVLAPVYLQMALGVPVSESGLLMIPLMVSTTLGAGFAGRSTKTTGRYKLPALIGLPVAVLALIVLGFEAQAVTPWAASALLMVAGLGMGPIFPCSMVAAQNAVEGRDLGTVSGTISFSRALGGAVLIAAASALVLGLYAGAMPGSGAATLEELARATPSAEARAAIGSAFAVLFWAVAAILVAGLALFARVEERPLRQHAGIAAPSVPE
ncbi:MDR family MFS transporter [Arenibaculum pallidiluteum]|uniref:MDR family MFS transporter n=1 Tax=Arenibaculum pallidiluteum TaxID=2812559 RepID=UPI001A958CBE|nr:MDR family MFS transporter [Arenibaculum pallidiluteum]